LSVEAETAMRFCWQPLPSDGVAEGVAEEASDGVVDWLGPGAWPCADVAAGSGADPPPPLMMLATAMKPPTTTTMTTRRAAPTTSRRRRKTGLTGFRTGFLTGPRAGCPLPEPFGREPFVPELPCLPILLG
jgi:hypothetical protein